MVQFSPFKPNSNVANLTFKQALFLSPLGGIGDYQ